MGFKVMKGRRSKPELDSTHKDRRKANDRATTLRNSYRGKKMEVWIEPTTNEDPVGYRGLAITILVQRGLNELQSLPRT